jgi:SAM-dependent methyltransferase
VTPARLYSDLAWVWPFLSPPEEYDEEAATYVAQFRRYGVPDGGRILHLGSGGGSLDWHLKQHYRVTGVDVSPAMLAYARGVNPEVEYRAGDIRDVRLGEVFDGVLLHDAIAYMLTYADLCAAYRTAAAHLAPGGVLLALPEELRSHFEQHHTDTVTRASGTRIVTSIDVDFDADPTDSEYETTYVFLIRDEGRLTVEVDTHRVGIYDLDQFVAAIAAAGFQTEICGGILPSWLPEQQYPLIAALRQ